MNEAVVVPEVVAPDEAAPEILHEYEFSFMLGTVKLTSEFTITLSGPVITGFGVSKTSSSASPLRVMPDSLLLSYTSSRLMVYVPTPLIA